MRTCFAILSAVLLAACGDSVGSTVDAGIADSSVPPWPHVLPPSDALRDRDEYVVARTILHSHSPISHDACDGAGYIDAGVVDETCLLHLRNAVCALHIDTLNLTDHASHLAEFPFEALFLSRETDTAVYDGSGALVGSQIQCPDGSTTLVTVGSENELMPIGLVRHPVESSSVAEVEAAYHADGPEGVALFRDAGALVFVAHTEQRELDVLRTLGMDGIEIYNVHANVDPRIRESWLGLPAADYLVSLLRFTNPVNELEPDLSFLSFFSENQNDLSKWDTLLAEGMRVTAIAGSDAHENSSPMRMPDGERGDSYRRMLRWFSNHLLVHERTYEGQREALLSARSYVAFEVFGSPVNFRYTATNLGDTVQMGGSLPLGATLHVHRPSMSSDVPLREAPEISVRVLRSIDMGRTEEHVSSDEEVSFTPTSPGAYRVEVRIVPHHLRPYLGAQADSLIHEYVWIYSNPIVITPP